MGRGQVEKKEWQEAAVWSVFGEWCCSGPILDNG